MCIRDRVNLVLDRPSVREFLQDACTPEALASALEPLLRESDERTKALRDLGDFQREMGVGGPAPSERAANAVLEMLGER